MILYGTGDLIFATKIRATAESMHVPTVQVRDAEALQNRLEPGSRGADDTPGAVTGVFVDLELGAEALSMIQRTKLHDPRTPVVAFGSHVAKDVLDSAKHAGADEVMPRSRFVVELTTLLERFGGGNV